MGYLSFFFFVQIPPSLQESCNPSTHHSLTPHYGHYLFVVTSSHSTYSQSHAHPSHINPPPLLRLYVKPHFPREGVGHLLSSPGERILIRDVEMRRERGKRGGFHGKFSFVALLPGFLWTWLTFELTCSDIPPRICRSSMLASGTCCHISTLGIQGDSRPPPWMTIYYTCTLIFSHLASRYMQPSLVPRPSPTHACKTLNIKMFCVHV